MFKFTITNQYWFASWYLSGSRFVFGYKKLWFWIHLLQITTSRFQWETGLFFFWESFLSVKMKSFNYINTFVGKNFKPTTVGKGGVMSYHVFVNASEREQVEKNHIPKVCNFCLRKQNEVYYPVFLAEVGGRFYCPSCRREWRRDGQLNNSPIISGW